MKCYNKNQIMISMTYNMIVSALLLGVVALYGPHAPASVDAASLRAFAKSKSKATATDFDNGADDTVGRPCSCDCCFSEKALPNEAEATAATALFPGLKCAAAQKIDFSKDGNEEGGAQDKCFDAFCAFSPAQKKVEASGSQFEDDGEYEDASAGADGDSRNPNNFDYVRYCAEECAPASAQAEMGAFCLDKSRVLTQQSAIEKQRAQAAAASKKKMLLKVSHKYTSASQSASEQALGAGAGKEPPIAVVEGMMLEAKDEAIRAGKAAMKAKMDYEKLLASVHKNAEQAGQTVLDEIKREARETATKALSIRKKYEAAATKNAQNAAVGIAKVYKNAFTKAQSVGGTWDLRSQEYATAAAQRKALSQDYEARSQTYLKDKEYDLSREYLLQAHQALTQATDFATQSTAAHEQAKKITGSLNWYVHSEYQAAAHVLAASTPPDVPVPGLPPLP